MPARRSQPKRRVKGRPKSRSTSSSGTTLKQRLARRRQIQISVIGRKSGKTISVPVWFVLEGNELLLLPVSGSETQWYRNLLRNSKIAVSAGGAERELRGRPITAVKAVNSVIEKFREKYGPENVRKYYSGFDVAVAVRLK